MSPRRWMVALAMASGVLTAPAARAEGPAVVRVGAGSFATAPPPGARRPPRAIYRTENARGAMPTNDWWSSLAWVPFSEPSYAHPLTVQAVPSGFQVHYPGGRVSANASVIFGKAPSRGDDLILGHSAQPEFPDARVDGFGDWTVTAKFAAEGRSMAVTSGHGSPFVYARFEGGSARLTFHWTPRIWSGDAGSPTLGITLNDVHYGLFGPIGSTWTGLRSKSLVNVSEKDYFSVAVLPDASEATLALFRRYAHAHPVDTRVEWSYGPRSSDVVTTFRYVTKPMEGSEKGTLFALYPHQWRNTDHPLLPMRYGSVRGEMKLAAGDSFRTTVKFPGLLPCLPDVGGADRARVIAGLEAEAASPEPPLKDTYWEGKWLGRVATLVPIAEEYGRDDLARTLRERLKARLERWFTATKSDGSTKAEGLFCHDGLWGTLIGYPASYGSDDELNDHHFHYGYFLKAAAEVARGDPSWGEPGRWGGMVDLLIRDVAGTDRDDPRFPVLRNFDPYAGHSWASGHARFADGNNNESSSEAMNAWTALVLWGEAVGDRATRDLGAYLYATEMTAIEEYWFDVHGRNRPEGFTPSVVTMVWGGKGVNETWFTANPEQVHGINWLPIHGGSLYLGRHPDYAGKNYAALVRENGGTNWDAWSDLVRMYRALSDPDDALRQSGDGPAEDGNSRANTDHWIAGLKALGRVDASVTADDPLAVAFRLGDARTYCVYGMTDRSRVVTFSDKTRVEARGRRFTVARPGR